MSKLKTENINPFYLGHLEMDRWQELLNSNHQNNLSSLIKTYGLIIQQTDTNVFATDWKVLSVSSNIVSVNTGYALVIKSDGKLAYIYNSAVQQVAIPSTDGTYKLLLAYTTKNTEIGTVALSNGSAAVLGTGTEFTKLFGPNRRLIVNDIPYTVLSVTDDTHLTLETPYSGGSLTLQPFKVGGWFPTYPAGIPDNYIYEYDSLQFVLRTGTKTNMEYWLAEVVVTGGVITAITDKRSLNIFKLNLNVPDLDQTTATTFMVGGRYVELEEGTPPNVKNIRIVDIFADALINPDASILTELTMKGIAGSSNKLNVSLKWGYDDITGNGGVNLFNINTAGLTFTANELAGYYLNVPSEGVNLKILSNTATSAGNTALTVEKEGGADWDGSGISVTTLNPATIHHNADRYEIVATPQIRGSNVYYASTPALVQEIIMQIDIGHYYYVKVRAIKGRSYNEYAVMGAGSFVKYGVTQNYGSPFLVRHPQISSAGVSVLPASSDSGFILDIISGWTEANEFEIVYSTESNKATFTEASGNTKEVFLRPHFEKITSISRRYYMRVRPLISGQAVAPEYPVASPYTLVSGVQGPQNQTVIAQPYIQHRTYSGGITISGSGVIGLLDTVRSPAGSATVVTGINNLEGSVITIADNDYMIQATLGGLYIELTPISPSPSLADGTYTFTIGVTKRARRKLRTNNYPINYHIIRIDVDSDVKRGEDITLRVYQESNEGAADSIIILNSETGYSKDVDIELSGTYGQRTLIIDLWDPAVSGAKNKGELSGLVTVYAMPLFSVIEPGGTGQ
jgi:hypothetical protein